MVETYWNVGKRIVEEEQKGGRRAEYGKRLIQTLAERLKSETAGRFSAQSLWNMRQFYSMFPILSAVRRELTWTHYKALIRVDRKSAREFYAEEAVRGNWSSRVLERQIHTFYYERLISGRNSKAVKEEAESNAKKDKESPEDFIKSPYVLEFLGMKQDGEHLEKDIEKPY